MPLVLDVKVDDTGAATLVRPTPIEALCRYLRIGLGDVKKFEDGGQELDLTTRQGTRYQVDRGQLAL